MEGEGRERGRERERERDRGLMVGGLMVGVRTNYLQARCSGEDGVTNFTLTPGRLSHQWPYRLIRSEGIQGPALSRR